MTQYRIAFLTGWEQMQNCGRLVQPQGHTVSRTERPVEAANTLNLWPEQHSQRQTFRVFSSSPSGDWGQEPLRQPRAPGVLRLQGLSQSSPSRISQTDQALAPCIWPSIVNSCAQGNAPTSEYPRPDLLACIPLNVSACGDELGMGA